MDLTASLADQVVVNSAGNSVDDGFDICISCREPLPERRVAFADLARGRWFVFQKQWFVRYDLQDCIAVVVAELESL